MRFERDDAKVGLLVLAAFALFALLAFQHGVRALFHPETVRTVRLANAADLAPGAEVQLQGARVGEVHTVEMERDGAEYRFVATFGLRRDITLWHGTKGVVTARVVGGPFLDLCLPPAERRLVELAPGEAIEGEPGASTGTLVTELTGLTRNLNVTVSELRQELKAHGLSSVLEQPEVRSALREFTLSLAAFRAASKTAQETLDHGDKTLQTADRNLASMEKALAVLQGLLERRGPELDAALARIGPALEKVQGAGADLSTLLKDAGPDAGKDLRALHKTLGSLQELLEILKAKPNRIVFGTPSEKERAAARKKVAEADSAAAEKPAEPAESPR